MSGSSLKYTTGNKRKAIAHYAVWTGRLTMERSQSPNSLIHSTGKLLEKVEEMALLRKWESTAMAR